MTLLIIFIWFYMYICQCNGDLVHHKGKIERLELLNINKEMGDANVTMSKFNKTSIGASLYIDLYQDVPNDMKADFQLYAEFSNHYQRMPCSIYNYNLCAGIEGLGDLIENQINKFGYLPSKCPIKKGVYTVKNFVLSDKVFPNFPWNKIMYEVNITWHSLLMVTGRCYVTIDRDTDMINKALGIA